MRFYSTDGCLIVLALAQASSAVVVPEPEHHVIRNTDAALKERAVGEFHPIAENKLGTVYSNVPPHHERRDNGDVSYHPISENEHGTVYSNVAPTIEKRSGVGDVTGQSDGP
ncbi:MAG: hypothetical protein Q9207_004284 [Kuettlingeria erythrocarpa]